jgi:hypothetical protein
MQTLLSHSETIDLVKDEFDLKKLKLDDFCCLCRNYKYLDVVNKHIHRHIKTTKNMNEVFENLCCNKNPNVINIIKKHIDITKIEENSISCLYTILPLVDTIKYCVENLKLDLNSLAWNSNIFTYDYEEIRITKQNLNEAYFEWLSINS